MEIDEIKINEDEEEFDVYKKVLETIELKRFNPIEFEKDDDSNHHIEFITSCSNLRAENYDIEPADFFKTKMIAGKIIPAMITTTAVVSGLECIEFYKIIQKKPIEQYDVYYLNLAVAYMDRTEPEQIDSLKICEGLQVNIWTQPIQFDGNCTLQQFLNIFENKYPFIVTSLTSIDGKVMYMDWKHEDRKSMKIIDICNLIFNNEFNKSELVVSVGIENETNNVPDEISENFPNILFTF